MILQIRGQKLDEYVIYAVIDMIDGASIEAQAIILVNQWEHQSTRTSVDSLQKQIKISETIVMCSQSSARVISRLTLRPRF